MKQETQEQFYIKKKKSIFDYSRRELSVVIVQIIGVFAILVLLAGFLGFLPEEFSFRKNNTQEVNTPNNTQINDLNNRESETVTSLPTLAPEASFFGAARPTQISIPKIGIDTNIEHPEQQDIATLNNALEKGAVHYPGSGTLSQGNIFLFGHSTNWKIVQNKAYQTFNGVENLVIGDEIIVGDGEQQVVYQVASVELVNDDEALVEIGGPQRKLTISTCNSFGEKQERWVVEAYPKA